MALKPKWGQFIETLRKEAGMTRRYLALTAGVDPSYMTLIENSGRVPKGDVAYRILEAATQNKLQQDVGMLLAGYAPRNVPLKEVTAFIKKIHEARTIHADTRVGGESPSVVLTD